MGNDAKRRDAIRSYKERKPSRGAFSVRCAATGQVWVGSSMNLDASCNSLWFMLRHGSHHDKALQAEWNAHGLEHFAYEILERLEDDVPEIAVKDLLKDQRSKWVAQLGARTLL